VRLDFALNIGTASQRVQVEASGAPNPVNTDARLTKEDLFGWMAFPRPHQRQTAGMTFRKCRRGFMAILLPPGGSRHSGAARERRHPGGLNSAR
jgi:hypothetical protein